MGSGASVGIEEDVQKSSSEELNTHRAPEGKFSIDIFLSNKHAKEYFMNFLKQEYSDENLRLYDEICQIKNQTDKGSLNIKAKEIYDTYIKPGASSETNIPDYQRNTLKAVIFDSNIDSSNDTADHEKDQQLILAIDQVKKEILGILTLGSFPRFMKSKFYTDFLEKHRSKVYEETSRDRCDSLDNLSTTEETLYGATVNNMFQLMKTNDVKDLINSEKWLEPLLVCCEKLPIAISIATTKTQGFPLIYVNKEFTNMTKFQKEDCIGKKCSFLQSDNSEAEQITKMQESLCNAQPIKVQLTNFKKNGEKFINLLAMKPIFDQDGGYRYVIALSSDVTSLDTTALKLSVADNILKLMPDMIFTAATTDNYVTRKLAMFERE